jgi:hypothetical protein
VVVNLGLSLISVSLLAKRIDLVTPVVAGRGFTLGENQKSVKFIVSIYLIVKNGVST